MIRRDIAALVVSRGLASLLQAASLVILARMTSVAVFGYVAIVASVAGLLLSVAEFGIATGLSRSRARRENEWVAALVHHNRLSVMTMAAVLATVIAGMRWGEGEVLGLVLLVLATGIEKDIDVTLSVAVADGRRIPTMVSIVLRRGAALGAFLVLTVYAAVEPVTAFGAGALAAAALAVAHRRTWMPSLGARGRGIKAGAVFRASLPFFLAGLPLHVRLLEAPLVGWASGPAGAGLYAAASRLISPLLLLASAASVPVMPHAVRADAGVVGRALRRVAILCAVGFALSIPVVLLAEPILVVLFGPSYALGAPVLRWLLLALPMIGVSAPLEAVLQARGSEAAVAKRAVVAGAVALVALGVGALLGGPTGAAVGLFAASAARLGLLMTLARALSMNGRDGHTIP